VAVGEVKQHCSVMETLLSLDAKIMIWPMKWMFSYLWLGDAIKRVGGTQIVPSPLHVLPSMFLSGLQLRERLVVCVRSTLLVLIWCYEYIYIYIILGSYPVGWTCGYTKLLPAHSFISFISVILAYYRFNMETKSVSLSCKYRYEFYVTLSCFIVCHQEK
jgi:hypothetical protein